MGEHIVCSPNRCRCSMSPAIPKSWWFVWCVYPLVNIQKAIENGPFIVDFPIKHGDTFHHYVSLPEGTESMMMPSWMKPCPFVTPIRRQAELLVPDLEAGRCTGCTGWWFPLWKGFFLIGLLSRKISTKETHGFLPWNCLGVLECIFPEKAIQWSLICWFNEYPKYAKQRGWMVSWEQEVHFFPLGGWLLMHRTSIDTVYGTTMKRNQYGSLNDSECSG